MHVDPFAPDWYEKAGSESKGYRAPSVVFNNGSLGFVELEMKATGFVNHGTELVNPDLAGAAKGIVILGQHVEDPGDCSQQISIFALAKKDFNHIRADALTWMSASADVGVN